MGRSRTGGMGVPPVIVEQEKWTLLLAGVLTLGGFFLTLGPPCKRNRGTRRISWALPG